MPGKLPQASLGKKGPLVDRLGYGCMGLSAFYGPKKPDAERFRVLDKLLEEGSTFWDTSDIYGDSEDFLGEYFKRNPGARKKIFLATKFGGGFDPVTKTPFVNSTPEYCRQACEKSLSRLSLPYVDLYYIHRLDRKTPIEKTMEAMKQLQQEGKIKYIGISECSSDSLRRAYKIAPVAAVQLEYSPFSLDIEDPKIALLKTCRELGVATVAYAPVGRGMLSGKFKSPADFEDGDFRKNAPRFSEENFAKNLELVKKITAIAEKHNATPAQLTLAWLMAQGHDIFPIPGTTNLDRVSENIGSTRIILSPAEEKEIRAAVEAAETHGDRYGGAAAVSLFADTPPLE